MAYSPIWTANLATEEEKEGFRQLLGVNNKVLDRLAEICYNMISELENNSTDFDNPNWALRQANYVGRKASLDRIAKLCSNTTA